MNRSLPMVREPPPSDRRAPPTAIQLHTLRSMPGSLASVVHRVAASGYDGVEFADRLWETDPAAVRTALAATDTVPVAAHVDLDRIEEDAERVVDRCRAIGCRRVVVPHVGAGHFRTTGRVDALARRLSSVAERLSADGVGLAYHNSLATLLPPLDQFGLGRAAAVPIPGLWQRVAAGLSRAARFGPGDIAARTGLGRLMAETPAALTFEVDVGWAAAAGYDPVGVMNAVGERLSAVHVTDVSMQQRYPRTFRSAAPGTGIVDLPRVVAAARAAPAEWLIYEEDAPTDPEVALRSGRHVLGIAADSGPDAVREQPDVPGNEYSARPTVQHPEQAADDD